MISIDYCRPTSADAIMFAYLAPILSMPFPKNRLRVHLEGYTNLCNTVHLIYKVYFPPSGEWKFQLFACFQCFCCYFTIKLTMNYIFYRNGNFAGMETFTMELKLAILLRELESTPMRYSQECPLVFLTLNLPCFGALLGDNL